MVNTCNYRIIMWLWYDQCDKYDNKSFRVLCTSLPNMVCKCVCAHKCQNIFYNYNFLCLSLSDLSDYKMNLSLITLTTAVWRWIRCCAESWRKPVNKSACEVYQIQIIIHIIYGYDLKQKYINIRIIQIIIWIINYWHSWASMSHLIHPT